MRTLEAKKTRVIRFDFEKNGIGAIKNCWDGDWCDDVKTVLSYYKTDYKTFKNRIMYAFKKDLEWCLNDVSDYLMAVAELEKEGFFTDADYEYFYNELKKDYIKELEEKIKNYEVHIKSNKKSMEIYKKLLDKSKNL